MESNTHTHQRMCHCMSSYKQFVFDAETKGKTADCDSFEDRKSAILLYTRASFTSLQTRESAEGAREVYREEGQ